MDISDAIDLIKNGPFKQEQSQTWADLGCGSGLFTRALSGLLPEGSIVYAVDKNNQRDITSLKNHVSVDFIRADFEKDLPALPGLNGILMANSLHYVRDKKSFLQNLIEIYPDISDFLIIEYEISRSNPWVPYPIGFGSLKELFETLGFSDIKKLSERTSAYQRGNIYACSAKKIQD